MQGIIYFAKRSAWILVLAALLSGALVQAQQLKAPKIHKIYTTYNLNIPNRLAIPWSHVEGEAGAEIWIKGPGKWKPKRQGGWKEANAYTELEDRSHAHVFLGLMPGNTYTFRVRAVDKDGKKGKASKPFKVKMIPCWIFNRYWETGYKLQPGDLDRPAPEKWKIKNTVNCEGVRFGNDFTGEEEEEPEDEG